MKTENHTVTIPIADYNELLSTAGMVGIKKIEENTPFYAAIKKAIFNQQRMAQNFASVSNGDPMKGVELFIRIR